MNIAHFYFSLFYVANVYFTLFRREYVLILGISFVVWITLGSSPFASMYVLVLRASYVPPCIQRHLRHNHETLNLLSLLTISSLYIHPLFSFLDWLGVFGGHRLNGCLSVSFFLLTPYDRSTIIAPATNATCHCTLIIRQLLECRLESTTTTIIANLTT